MERDFAAEVVVLEASLEKKRDVAVARLRTLHEAWGRALLGADEAVNLVSSVRAVVERGITPGRATAAVEQFRAAETHQWEIGTWSTGSGEGLSSMREVRELQLAQAWLWAARAPDDPDAEAKARKLLGEAAEDPNRVAAPYSAQIRALYERLDRG